MKPLETGDPQTFGQYELMGRLGSGGMGEVFLGRSPQGQLAAIKVARGEFANDAEFRRRFAREVQAAQKVDGRFTAAVLDADPEARRPWLATAYIPATSLADAVSNEGVLPESSLRALLAGIAEALDAIHGAGLTHRDLKPANVLLADDGPRVIDFGISRSAEHSQITMTGQFTGTPGFTAPEQFRGAAVGPHTDVYALGATLVFAAVGAGPFGQGDTFTLMYRALEEEPQLDGVPEGLRGTLERCLAKDPAQRPTIAALRGEFAVPNTFGESRWLPRDISTVLVVPQQVERVPGDGTFGSLPTSSREALAFPPPPPGPAAPGAPSNAYGPAYVPTQLSGAPSTAFKSQPAHSAPPPSDPVGAVRRKGKGKGMSRRSLLALAGLGVVAVGGGGTAAVLGLRGGDDPDDGTVPPGEPAEGSGPLPKVVAGTGLGENPKLDKQRGTPPGELVVRTLISGKGPKIRKSQRVKCHYILQEWKTALVKVSSFRRGGPVLIEAGGGQSIRDWDRLLVGRREGSRLEISLPPDRATNKAQAVGSIPPKSTVLCVVDILDISAED